MIKKIMGFLMLVLVSFIFIGCNGNVVTTNEPSTTEQPITTQQSTTNVPTTTEQPITTQQSATNIPTTETQTTEVPTTVEDSAVSQVNVDTYKEESVTIQFHYYLSQSASSVLQSMIVAF